MSSSEISAGDYTLWAIHGQLVTNDRGKEIGQKGLAGGKKTEGGDSATSGLDPKQGSSVRLAGRQASLGSDHLFTASLHTLSGAQSAKLIRLMTTACLFPGDQ